MWELPEIGGVGLWRGKYLEFGVFGVLGESGGSGFTGLIRFIRFGV